MVLSIKPPAAVRTDFNRNLFGRRVDGLNGLRKQIISTFEELNNVLQKIDLPGEGECLPGNDSAGAGGNKSPAE